MQELTGLKELTGQQYDAAKARAVERVQTLIGDKPTRRQFKREYAPLWTVLDALAGAIFLAALAISSIHILAYSGHEATNSFATVSQQALLGIQINPGLYGVVHQVGFILLAEAAMLLFFVLFRTRRGSERWLSLALALMAMTFVIVANLSSGLNAFLAVLAPAFTIGVGFRLEALVAESLRRNAEIDKRYTDALLTWERAQEDITTHPEYTRLLYSEIWDKLTSLKANAEYRDAPKPFRLAAVQRELQRENWAADVEAVSTATTPYTQSFTLGQGNENGHQEVAPAAPLAGTVTSQNGNGHH